ncbi:MAG: hypothetical protein UZ22_OP11002000098 [Microgenomates bacterium OLB23]|nr:MAG: hypothetical protein UZ22_OP11002000098 [Microgenomates bacterium OLB23]
MYKYIQSNVWFGGKLHEKLIPFIKNEQPDFVALQEVIMPRAVSPYTAHPALDFLHNLKQATGLMHSVFVPETGFSDKTHYDNENLVDMGVAILSKFPIKSYSYINYIHEYQTFVWETMDRWDIMPKGLLTAHINTPNKPLYVATTHGVWGTDDKDNADRDIMIDCLLKETRGKTPLLLSGDLNIDQQSQGIGRLEEQLVNVFKGKLKTSFNMRHKSGGTFDQSVVDFIFATKDIKIIKAYSTNEDVSDHLPLLLEFEL